MGVADVLGVAGVAAPPELERARPDSLDRILGERIDRRRPEVVAIAAGADQPRRRVGAGGHPLLAAELVPAARDRSLGERRFRSAAPATAPATARRRSRRRQPPAIVCGPLRSPAPRRRRAPPLRGARRAPPGRLRRRWRRRSRAGAHGDDRDCGADAGSAGVHQGGPAVAAQRQDRQHRHRRGDHTGSRVGEIDAEAGDRHRGQHRGPDGVPAKRGRSIPARSRSPSPPRRRSRSSSRADRRGGRRGSPRRRRFRAAAGGRAGCRRPAP